MQFYLAPLEGVTGYVLRNAFHHYFDDIDCYFTPFIPYAKRMNKKIIRDINPDNNQGIKLIPQVMSNKADEVIELSHQLREYGYDTLNVNLGCPSGTVVSKKRGSGLLYYPEELDAFLYELFDKSEKEGIHVSIKTRLGFSELSEWEKILEIYGKYTMDELIIHPRIQKEFYRGNAHLEEFQKAISYFDAQNNATPLCYNGDIFDLESYQKIALKFPSINRLMLGRGLIARPGLIGLIKTGSLQTAYRKDLEAFHDEIYNGCLSIFSGEKDVIFHMKEIWSYLQNSFEAPEKYIKKLRKATSSQEYKAIVHAIFSDLALTTTDHFHVN